MDPVNNEVEGKPWEKVWDAGKGMLVEGAKKAIEAVPTKLMPWERDYSDKTPKAPSKTLDMTVPAVPVTTEAQMRIAVMGVGPDTSDPAKNIVEIQQEMKRSKDPKVLQILQEELDKNTKRLKGK